MCLPWFRRRSSADEKSSSKAHLNSTHSKESKSELTTAVQKPSAQKGKGPSYPQFSQARTRELFNAYRDEEVTDEEVIGSDGIEKLCQDTQMDMEGAKPLVLAWILGAKTLGRFSKAEWDSGTSSWQWAHNSKFMRSSWPELKDSTQRRKSRLLWTTSTRFFSSMLKQTTPRNRKQWRRKSQRHITKPLYSSTNGIRLQHIANFTHTSLNLLNLSTFQAATGLPYLFSFRQARNVDMEVNLLIGSGGWMLIVTRSRLLSGVLSWLLSIQCAQKS